MHRVSAHGQVCCREHSPHLMLEAAQRTCAKQRTIVVNGKCVPIQECSPGVCSSRRRDACATSARGEACYQTARRLAVQPTCIDSNEVVLCDKPIRERCGKPFRNFGRSCEQKAAGGPLIQTVDGRGAASTENVVYCSCYRERCPRVGLREHPSRFVDAQEVLVAVDDRHPGRAALGATTAV